MPATKPSRSPAVDPPIRMTAGSGPLARAGLATLAARPNPVAGMRTLSSPGTENDVVRVAADAMSSRATSSVCAGTLMRSSAPFASAQTLTRMSAAGCGLDTISA